MQIVLAIISGILSFMAFPRIGWWPLVFVAQVPLMVALSGASTRKRILYGWITGVVFTLGMQYWVAETMVALSGFTWVLACLALLVYSAYLGLQWAVFAALYEPLRRWTGRRGGIITISLLYVVLERVFPVVFPYTLAASLYEIPVLLQTAAWVGISGPSFMVMLVSCSLVCAAEDVSKRRVSDHVPISFAAALWLVTTVMGMAIMQQVWTAPVKNRTTVALIQPNVTVAEKHAKGTTTRKLVFERTSAMTREALALRPDLIVWPEGGFPFRFQSGDSDETQLRGRHHQMFSNKLYKLALETGVDLIVGSLRQVGDRVRNSIVHLPKGGARALTYDKRLLLMFGERVPFADSLPWLKNKVKGMSHHEAGSTFTHFNAAGTLWTPSLCYEAIFAGFTRQALNFGDGGQVLLNLTNDVWFGNTAAADHHLMVQTVRTIENRRWLIRSTNSGISAFIDPTGTIRARTAIDREAILAAEIDVLAIDPPFYARHGDIFLYVLVIISLLFLFIKNRHRFGNKRSRAGVTPARPEVVDQSG